LQCTPSHPVCLSYNLILSPQSAAVLEACIDTNLIFLKYVLSHVLTLTLLNIFPIECCYISVMMLTVCSIVTVFSLLKVYIPLTIYSLLIVYTLLTVYSIHSPKRPLQNTLCNTDKGVFYQGESKLCYFSYKLLMCHLKLCILNITRRLYPSCILSPCMLLHSLFITNSCTY